MNFFMSRKRCGILRPFVFKRTFTASRLSSWGPGMKIQKKKGGGWCPSLFVELPVFSTRKTPWRSWKINFWVFFFLSDVYFVFLHCPSLQIILFVSSPRFDVTRQEKDMRVLAQMLADAELELFHGQHLDPKIFKVIDGLVIQICKI